MLLFLLLGLHGQLFKLVPIQLHVRSYDGVGDRRDSLVPVLVLAALEQSLDHDWVCLIHVRFDYSEYKFAVEEEKGALRRLIVHALGRAHELPQQLGAELVKFLISFVSEKFEHLFNLVNEDDLLGGAGDGPDLEQTRDQGNGQ